jgi:hypothetical protein
MHYTVGAGLFAAATMFALKGFLSLVITPASILSLFLIFLLFIDAAHSALRFHSEDLDRQ